MKTARHDWNKNSKFVFHSREGLLLGIFWVISFPYMGIQLLEFLVRLINILRMQWKYEWFTTRMQTTKIRNSRFYHEFLLIETSAQTTLMFFFDVKFWFFLLIFTQIHRCFVCFTGRAKGFSFSVFKFSRATSMHFIWTFLHRTCCSPSDWFTVMVIKSSIFESIF